MSVSFLRRFLSLAAASILSLVVSAHAGTFKNPELIDTAFDPAGTAAGDFNGDGILDSAYVDGMSPLTLHVLLGKGNGTFSHGEDIDLPQGVGGVINLADATGDGITDIIMGGSDANVGELAVLVGNGDGTFQTPIVSKVANSGSNGGYPSFNAKMGIADVNGDGAADIVIGDAASATVYVLLGDKTGKFSVHTTMTYYFTGEVHTYLFDVNGDGHLDIVLNDLVGAQSYVLLGNGDGTFKAAAVYLSFAVLFADMDGDGHPDLVGEVYPGQVQILKGNPDGTFGSPSVITTVPNTARLIASGDFNGDGIIDLAFLTPAGIGIVLGKGNLTYGSIHTSVAGTLGGIFHQSGEIAQGDFNRDGHLDIAMGVDGGLLILAGNGDGTFASADTYDIGHPVGTVAVANFNGDQYLDIAATVPAIYPRLLVGDGTGKFGLGTDQNQSYGSQDPSGSVVTADFNGDGKNDLDILEPTQGYPFGQPFVLFGVGDGTFQTPLAISTGPSFVADVNNDGRSDMISQAGNTILAMLGHANGTFSQVTTILNYPTFGVAAVGDLNHDGKADVLVFEPYSMRLWLGKGDGTFAQSGLVSSSQQLINAESVIIADLDGDGNADVIVVQYPNQLGLPFPILIYYGNGDGTFQDGVLLPLSHSYTQLVVADINRDNKPDLVLSDGAGIAVITNLGNRSFGSEEHFVAGQKISGLSVADVNGDGFPDIVAANAGGTTVAVLLNQPNGNPIDGAPSNGAFSISPEPAQYAQPVTLSITMSAPSGPVPTGSVAFSVDGSFIADAPLTTGKSTYTFNGVLNTGTHTFVATYNGDNVYAPESFSVLHTVLPPVYATTTVLVATPKVVFTSQTLSLTATVSSSVPVPAGTVTFLDGTNTIGSRTIYQNPVVLLDTNLLAAGVHSLTAVYQGYQDPFNEQAIYQPSASAPVTVTVNAITTTTALSASTTSPIAGTVVTFTANVSSGSGAPFGGATFYDGTVPLGTSSLHSDGSCTYSTASLGFGTHNITAVYNANATFAGSTSSVIVVTVASAALSLSRTVVTVGATASGDQSLLNAKVRAGSGLPTGEVIFLDNGNILASASTSGAGTAYLTVPLLGGGVHNLSASFAGDSQFAPSVSPDLLEQSPVSGSDFSLTIAADSVEVTPAGSQPVLLIVGPKAGFQQQVQIACVDGVPAGYECSFSPAILSGGNSYLRVRASSNAGIKHANASALYETAIGIFSLFVIGTVSRRRVCCLVLLIGCLLGFTIMTGCGNPSTSSGEPQMMVLSIRAAAGTGGSTIVHSVQILLNVHSAN